MGIRRAFAEHSPSIRRAFAYRLRADHRAFVHRLSTRSPQTRKEIETTGAPSIHHQTTSNDASQEQRRLGHRDQRRLGMGGKGRNDANKVQAAGQMNRAPESIER